MIFVLRSMRGLYAATLVISLVIGDHDGTVLAAVAVVAGTFLEKSLRESGKRRAKEEVPGFYPSKAKKWCSST